MEDIKSKVEKHSKKLNRMHSELSKVIVGNEDVLKSLLRALVCNGHVILEGPSGTGKTLMVKALNEIVSNAEYKRVQFTVDLLPSDITGSEIYRKKKKTFEIMKGPVFSNFMLADEINRSPPKVQSALLEAMEEREVTIGRKTLKLPKPFIAFATRNPQEEQGVFSLPEAQVDRFLFEVKIGYLNKNLEKKIMEQNIELKKLEDYDLEEVVSLEEILQMQGHRDEIELPDEVKEYSSGIVSASRYPEEHSYDLKEYVQWGGSPRATIALNMAARANAMLEGRVRVKIEDIKEVVHDVLRHRIILSYAGKTEGIEKDKIIDSIIQEVPTLV